MPKNYEIITFKAPIGTKARARLKATAHGLRVKPGGKPSLTDYYVMIEQKDNILEQ